MAAAAKAVVAAAATTVTMIGWQKDSAAADRRAPIGKLSAIIR